MRETAVGYNYTLVLVTLFAFSIGLCTGGVAIEHIHQCRHKPAPKVATARDNPLITQEKSVLGEDAFRPHLICPFCKGEGLVRMECEEDDPFRNRPECLQPTVSCPYCTGMIKLESM